jgi:predicted NAD/FAD-dependent oxidoreductase
MAGGVHRTEGDEEMSNGHPEQSATIRTAVVGAGMSGLVCARELSAAGFTVRVFEKSRGPGGRTSTRRDGELRFDHGAQYFTARDPRFRDQVREWQRQGLAAQWRARIGVANDGPPVAGTDDVERWVGVPGMNALCRSMADDLDVVYGTRVGRITRTAGRWRLATDHGDDLGGFDWVVVSAPPAQTAELVRGASHAIATAAAAVPMTPCWAVMATFEEALETPFDGVFVRSGPLSWAARNSSKPDRRAEPDAWILHGSPEWSESHIEAPPEDVCNELLAALARIEGRPVEAARLRAHRWRYALPIDPLSSSCLFDGDAPIVACGDWCGGPRVEGAYLSGLAAAEGILGDPKTVNPDRGAA